MQRLLATDAAAVVRLNAAARTSTVATGLTVRSASGLAAVEVALMGLLVVGGRPAAALRMLGAVGVIYVVSEALGTAWPRQRPFKRLAEVETLLAHTDQRSFPSRHVASGLAMAVIGQQAHPQLGVAMAVVAWLLGVSRVAAGLHYPSDVLAGAVLGVAVGWRLRSR